MTTPVEILIHVSAPSGGRDDANYRTQARGLLDFVPVRRYDLGTVIVRLNDGGLEEETGESTRPRSSSIPPEEPIEDPSSFPDSQDHDGAINFQRQSQDQAPNLLRTAGSVQTPTAAPETTLHSISSIRSIYYPQTPGFQVSRTPALKRPQTAPERVAASPPPQPLTRSFSDSWDSLPSVIPDSQPSQRSLKRKLESSDLESSSQAESPSVKRPRLHPLAPSQVPVLPSSSPLDADIGTGYQRLPPSQHIHDTTDLTDSTDSSDSILFFNSLPEIPDETIGPAPPSTSIEPFKTHITRSLLTITKQLPLHRHFKPRFRLRPPSAWERGYWYFIVPKSWDPGLRAKFWKFWKDLINGNMAGGGVWMERFAIPACNASAGAPRGRGEEAEGTAEVVKVWCWGEVVEYIWLMLYTSSHGKFKGCGAAWINWEGEVVVRME